jgi:hypothetical protein
LVFWDYADNDGPIRLGDEPRPSGSSLGRHYRRVVHWAVAEFQRVITAPENQTLGTAQTSSSPAPPRNFVTSAYSGEFQTERIALIDENSKITSRRPSW